MQFAKFAAALKRTTETEKLRTIEISQEKQQQKSYSSCVHCALCNGKKEPNEYVIKKNTGD